MFGNNFANYSLQAGNEVIGIGRSPRKSYLEHLDFPYFIYHLTYELEYVLKVIDQFKPDVVVNFAAQGEGAASWDKDNWRFYETNCVGLVKLTNFLNCHFIQIGSSEVYGSVNRPISEDSLLNPTSPYSVSKAAFDLHLMAMHKVKGMPINIVRPSNCYAPGQQLHRIIPKAFIYGLTERKIPLHGGGRAQKSYLHATDLSSAILTIIKQAPFGEIYNVGPDDPISIWEVVSECALTLGLEPKQLIEEVPERVGQDSCYWLDSGKIKQFGWNQEIGFQKGLEDMLQWIKKYPQLLKLPTEFVMRA